MAIHYRTQGLILKKIDQGEADRIFAIYTKDFGKLEILAKAVRKIKSKLRGGLELFYLSEIEFIQGKTYKTLTDAILIENFRNLRKDLIRLKIAFKIGEVSDNLLKGEEKDEKTWQLLAEIFGKLNNRQLSSTNCQLLYYYFLWNFLSILGYPPQLYSCSLCQKKLVLEKLYFISREGGVICQICFKNKKKESISRQKEDYQLLPGVEIDPAIIKILRIILKKDWKILSRLKIKPEYLKSLKKISEDYLLAVFDLK